MRNQLLVHRDTRDLCEGRLITGPRRSGRVHVPVIPTVASPKNTIGSRPCKSLNEISRARKSRTEYHNRCREVNGLCREICDSSLESEQSRWNRCDLQKLSLESLATKHNDAHCLPSVALSSDGEVLGPVQSSWCRLRSRPSGIAPGYDGNDTVLLFQ